MYVKRTSYQEKGARVFIILGIIVTCLVEYVLAVGLEVSLFFFSQFFARSFSLKKEEVFK